MTSDDNLVREKLARIGTPAPLLSAAENAVKTCLSSTSEDRAVVIFDGTTEPIAAALLRTFDEMEIVSSFFSFDDMGLRPLTKLPASVAQTFSSATVSAMAVTPMRGELSARKKVLELVTAFRVRHAHMPSITPEIFVDGLAMDYLEVSSFMKVLMGHIEKSNTLTMTSKAGTHLEFTYPTPPVVDELNGLINPGRWQNLPSGQIIIYPAGAEGVFVADRNIGDWFEHKYEIAKYPVTFEFERGHVKSIQCENKRLERDLWLFIRSSDNSGRISELIVGANLGLTSDHSNALYDGYRPGASISLGAAESNPKLDWSSTTMLPMMGKQNGILLGDGLIMTDDVFAPELLP